MNTPATNRDATWTIGRLLQWTTEHLEKKGADSPRLDAEVLLAKARGCTRVDLYTAFEEVADAELRASFRELVRRRLAGTPVAYLVGQREFYSLSFEVTPAVLIPRPETEHVVLRLLELANPDSTGPAPRVLDLGTGSGVLAVCAAKYLPKAEVVAVDCSREALEVAQRNVERHQVEDCVRLIQSDWLESLQEEPPFDFIVSNPPYVSEQEFAELPVDVREHEPAVALVSDEDGLGASRRIIDASPAHLKPGGWLILETSPMLADRVAERFRQSECFDREEIGRDLGRRQRVVSGRRA